DEADVIARAEELARFVERVVQQHRLAGHAIVAVGYSNGANIAAAMLLLGLAPFREAILFRPMVPLAKSPDVALPDTRVLIAAGRFDPIATTRHVQNLVNLLRNRRVQVDLQFHESGHELTPADVTSARDLLGGAAIA